MANPSKSQLVGEIHTLLKKRYKVDEPPAKLSVLEAVVFGICHEGIPLADALATLERFKADYFDWNEVRVSAIVEIEETLGKVADSEARATAIRRFLRQLFDKTYGFTLDALAKKPLKESSKTLEEYDALKSDYVMATVIRMALGGHGMPVDAPMRRAFERLGVADAATDTATLRASLERAVAKNKGAEFCELVLALALDTCVDGEPDCPACELKKICPTAKVVLSAEAPAKKAAKAATSVDADPKAKPVPAEKPAAKAAKSAEPKDKEKAAPTKAAKPEPAAATKPASKPKK